MSVLEDLDKLETSSGTVLNNCYYIKELHADNIKTASNVFVLDCHDLQSISANSLEYFDTGSWGKLIMNCSSLKEARFPNLSKFYAHSINTDSWICYNNPSLRILVFGNIIDCRFTQNTDFNGCLNLIHIEFSGNGLPTKFSVDMHTWKPTYAFDSNNDTLVENRNLFTNNLQQFLYNFRTYIIDRLYNYTGSSRHTLTINSTVRKIVLGLDESGYANTFYMPDEPDIDYVTSLNQKLTDINWGLAYV